MSLNLKYAFCHWVAFVFYLIKYVNVLCHFLFTVALDEPLYMYTFTFPFPILVKHFSLCGNLRVKKTGRGTSCVSIQYQSLH